MASAGARAYNGSLGAEPPAGVQGAEPPEAEKLFAFGHPLGVANLCYFFCLFVVFCAFSL